MMTEYGADFGIEAETRISSKGNEYEVFYYTEVETIESGTTADRDSLRQVKEEVDRTESETVLSRTIDRIARGPLELTKAFKSFGNVNVKVVEGMEYYSTFEKLYDKGSDYH